MTQPNNLKWDDFINDEDRFIKMDLDEDKNILTIKIKKGKKKPENKDESNKE